MTPMGPVGYAWTQAKANTVPLYRCSKKGFLGSTHYVSADPGCGGDTSEGLLGFVLPG